jgi:uncharacterized protein (DUF2147 family)
MIPSPLHHQAYPEARGNLCHRPSSRRISVIVALIGAVALARPSLAAPPQDITGVWLTNDNEGAIEIRPCGDQRCGRIAWMKEPKGPDGKPPLDRNNPDSTLRARTICGLQIISGLKPQDDGSWGQGKVYDPDSGKTYDMKIRRETPETVKATGYMGFELLGQSMQWRRAPQNLGRCDDPKSK